MISCQICGDPGISTGYKPNNGSVAIYVSFCVVHWKEHRNEYHRDWREKNPGYHAEKMRKLKNRVRIMNNRDDKEYDHNNLREKQRSIEYNAQLQGYYPSCPECGSKMTFDYGHGEYFCSCGIVDTIFCQ